MVCASSRSPLQRVVRPNASAAAVWLVVASLAFCDVSWAKALIRGDVGRIGKKAGREINKGAIAVGKGAEHLGQQIGNTADRMGSEFEKGLCNFFTFGRSETGEASCSVSGGAGVDEKGAYTYDPAKPEVKYRGNEQPSTGTAEQLVRDAKYLNLTTIRTWEYTDNDILGIHRFLPPDTVLGEAWPDAAAELKPPTADAKIRPCGAQGCGGFLSPRSSEKAPFVRFHAGVDYLTKEGDPIYAPMNGYVERIKNPGRAGLNGLLLKNSHGYTATVYYVRPTDAIQEALEKGVGPDGISLRYPVEAGKTVIGYAQDLHPAYPPGVEDHVHLTLTDPLGNAVSPDGTTRIKKTPKTP